MATLSRATLGKFFARGDKATTAADRGKVLEDLVCYLFQRVPGVIVQARNRKNVMGSEEIDVSFWNDKSKKGLYFLPYELLVECKNWTSPVGSKEVSYFANILHHRGHTHGILVATNGITGDPVLATDAQSQIAAALRDGVRVVVLTRKEILDLTDSAGLIRLIQRKLCEIAVSGTMLPD
jgi:Restriction endonuclease